MNHKQSKRRDLLRKLMRLMCRTVLRAVAKTAPDGNEPLPDLRGGKADSPCARELPYG